MKLLFLKKAFNPYGGAEIYFRKVVEKLKKFAKVDVFSEKWEDIPEVEFKKARKHKIFYVFGLSPLSFALSAKKFVEKYGKSYDLVISFERTLIQDIYRASDGCHKRWLIQRKLYIDPLFKRVYLDLSPKHKVLTWLERECLKNSKIIITNSHMVKQDFKDFYGEEIAKKCKTIYNGVEIEKFKKLNPKERSKLRLITGFDLKKPILLFVGSGYFRKGLIYVLEVLKLLTDYNLIVIGKEQKENHFKRLVEVWGIKDRVYFLGARRDVAKFYQISDVFILPTIYDPFSNVVLEAMACGLPVITTSANGASEIIENNKSGFIIDFPIDIENLAIKVETAYKNREFLGENAYNTAQKFSLQEVVKNFYDLIKDQLGSKD